MEGRRLSRMGNTVSGHWKLGLEYWFVDYRQMKCQRMGASLSLPYRNLDGRSSYFVNLMLRRTSLGPWPFRLFTNPPVGKSTGTFQIKCRCGRVNSKCYTTYRSRALPHPHMDDPTMWPLHVRSLYFPETDPPRTRSDRTSPPVVSDVSRMLEIIVTGNMIYITMWKGSRKWQKSGPRAGRTYSIGKVDWRYLFVLICTFFDFFVKKKV